MIERHLEKKVVKLLRHFPAVTILGARQVGKTTLAQMLRKKLGKDTVYLDLENPADLAKLDNTLIFLRENQDKCVIIDEVQRKQDLFPVLRSLIDEHRIPARFLLLGSANPNLLRLSSETLAGRIVYLELSPFNYYEIRHLAPITSHWLNGGFPEPFLMADEGMRYEWFKSFIMTYVERDLPMLGFAGNPHLLLRLLYMIAHTHGQLLNKSTFAKALELSSQTISNYLEYFNRSYITRLLQPFYFNIKKRISKSPKIYFRDSGLLHHILRIQDYNSLLGHPVVGHSWEGYIIEQICSVLGDSYDYFFYRTQNGAECDLVIADKLKPLACVEVKFSSAPKKTKSLTTALQDIAADKNFIIIPDCTLHYSMDENLRVCNLEQFFDLFFEEQDNYHG